MKIAIHQPNFCPYEGFWQKMRAVDRFVILTQSQYRKGGYENRFQHLGRWYTMSVNKGLRPLDQKQYVNHESDWARIVNEFPQLESFTTFISENLVLTNSCIIMRAKTQMGIDTELVTDYETELTGTDRLVDLCKFYKATEYLSGPSGRKYLEMEKFEKAGIKVSFQDQSGKRSMIELI